MQKHIFYIIVESNDRILFYLQNFENLVIFIRVVFSSRFWSSLKKFSLILCLKLFMLTADFRTECWLFQILGPR